MKSLYASSLLTFALCSTLSANTQETPSHQPSSKQDYTDPITFMSDFLDITQKPHEPLTYWVKQVFFLFNHEPKLKPFIKELALQVRHRDANSILRIFLTYQGLFPAPLRQFIIGKGLANVKDSLTRRVALAP